MTIRIKMNVDLSINGMDEWDEKVIDDITSELQARMEAHPRIDEAFIEDYDEA